jgi:glyoxylase-like metal-dependent hydrolase (beta-lactamase superfamily II)
MQVQSAFTRRRFISTAAGSVAALIAAEEMLTLPAMARPAQDPRIATTPVLDRGFAASRKIGEGVYATIADGSKGFQAGCNGGFVVGKDAALLFEGHWTPAGAQFEFDALRAVSQVPVKAAINSHYHFDHSFGNAFYGVQGIPIWAHARSVALMQENYAAIQQQDAAALAAPWEQRVRDAKDEAAKRRAEGDLRANNVIFRATQSTVVALPNVPLATNKFPVKVDLGGLNIVIETHPGHTQGDIIVRVPEQNLTLCGDLLFNGSYPVSFDADLPSWRRVLTTFASYGKDALFVPGHGPVCSQDGISLLASVFDDIAEQAEKLFRAGVPVQEARERYVIPERFAKLGMFSWDLTIGAAVASFYRSFSR